MPAILIVRLGDVNKPISMCTCREGDHRRVLLARVMRPVAEKEAAVQDGELRALQNAAVFAQLSRPRGLLQPEKRKKAGKNLQSIVQVP